MTQIDDDTDYLNDDGLIFAWLLDGKGGGRPIGWDEIDTCKPDTGEWIWIHFDYTSEKVQHWMHTKSGLNSLTAESLLQAETRPRCVVNDDGLMLFLRGVNMNPGADPEDMVSVRVIIDQKRVISLRMRHIMSIQDIHQLIRQGRGSRTPANFINLLVDQLLDRVGHVIDQLYDSIDRTWAGF